MKTSTDMTTINRRGYIARSIYLSIYLSSDTDVTFQKFEDFRERTDVRKATRIIAGLLPVLHDFDE